MMFNLTDRFSQKILFSGIVFSVLVQALYLCRISYFAVLKGLKFGEVGNGLVFLLPATVFLYSLFSAALVLTIVLMRKHIQRSHFSVLVFSSLSCIAVFLLLLATGIFRISYN